MAADDLAPGIHQAICIHGTEICCHCFEISKRDHNWLNTLLVEKFNTVKPKRVILHVSYLKCRFMHFPNEADIIFWDRHWLSNLPRSSAIPRRYMLDSGTGSCTNLFDSSIENENIVIRDCTRWRHGVQIVLLTTYIATSECSLSVVLGVIRNKNFIAFHTTTIVNHRGDVINEFISFFLRIETRIY